MKKSFLTSLALLITLLIFAQKASNVAINTDGSLPDNSAMLDVKSTNMGMLFPRLTETQRNSLSSPGVGLLIYNSTSKQFNYFNGGTWNKIEGTIAAYKSGSTAPGGGVSMSVGTDVVADKSAMLDVSSTTKGVLIPRTQPHMISSPATGLIIYNPSTNKINYYNGSQWKTICSISTGNIGASTSQTSAGFAINEGGGAPAASAILDIQCIDKGLLVPRMDDGQRNGILPSAGLLIYNTWSNNLQFWNGANWCRMNEAPVAPSSGTLYPSPTEITWNWNSAQEATGYKWNTTDNIATATDMGTSTSKTETGLTDGTIYTRYVWAYNSCDNSPVLILTAKAQFVCGSSSIRVNHVAGSVAPETKTVSYGTVTNIPGETSKCWITRNLGATQQASNVDDTSEPSAGWYWQFNRKQGFKQDGSPKSAWIQSPNGKTGIVEYSDWTSWNDPCTIELGAGWRIPTRSEWENVDKAGNWTDWNGPWNSGLRLHGALCLWYGSGAIESWYNSSGGSYWSSSQIYAKYGIQLEFFNASCFVWTGLNKNKTNGYPVRCIKD
ncbi:MAG: hypothetical protein WCI31_07405 [Prolixibacteraceae bacterium]